MTCDTISKKTFINRCYIYIKIMWTVFAVFIIAFTLLRFPENSARGALNGINICINILIPTLFPFLVLSSFLVISDLCSKLSKPFKGLTKFLFSQNEQAFCVFVLSMTGGYPVGAKTIITLYENAEISLNQGKRMILFCMGPGPAFVISTVGYFMLGSQKIGILIYISVVLSSLILGVMTKFLYDDEKEEYIVKDTKKSDKNFSDALVKAVSQSVNSILSICAWVILFSSFKEIIEITIQSDNTKAIICSLAEVTTGCQILSNTVPVAVIAGVIGFGGLCTHFQVMPTIIKMKLKFKHFLVARIISGTLSMVICQTLLDLLPQSSAVFAVGEKPVNVNGGESFSITLFLFLLSCLVIIGDNTILKIRTRRSQK